MTLVEVLVVIVVSVLLFLLIAPPCCPSRERGNRIKCASNLRGIGLALAMYCEQYGSYPMTDSDGCSSPEKVYELLPHDGDMTPKVFICPSSSEPEPTDTRLQRSSYGFSCSNVKANKTWPTTRPASDDESPAIRPGRDYIIASDRRNGGGSGSPQKSRQSKNHAGDGQNVLFADGHAEFITNLYKHTNSAVVEVTDDIFADEAIEPDTFIQD